MTITPEQVVLIAGTALAIIFEWLPVVKDWYDKKSKAEKQGIMLGLITLTVAGAFGLSCAKLISAFTCDWMGVWDAVQLFLLTIGVNQGVHLITKKAKAVG